MLFNDCELRGHIGTGIGSNSTCIIIGRPTILCYHGHFLLNRVKEKEGERSSKSIYLSGVLRQNYLSIEEHVPPNKQP
jgi:hypothetical protein